MMVRLALGALLLCLAPTTHAQSLDALAPGIPTPEAASVQRLSSETVDMSTGAVNVSVPLYTLQGERMTLPISLTYRSNGIRVEDRAGPVGLGWTLQAAGAVTRSLAGRPDEGGYFRPADLGLYAAPGLNEYVQGYENQSNTDCTVGTSYGFPRKVADGEVDGEPDVFHFSGLLSGSFFAHRDVWDWDDHQATAPPLEFLSNPLTRRRITYTEGTFPAISNGVTVVGSGKAGCPPTGCSYLQSYGKYVSSWTVTDVSGNTYLYSHLGGTETDTEQVQGGTAHHQKTSYVSSWGLSQVVNSRGAVEFDVESVIDSYAITSRPRKEWTYSFHPDGYTDTSPSTSQATTFHQNPLVTTIESQTQKAVFWYSPRADGAERLDRIDILDLSSGALVVQFTFAYEDAVSASGDRRLMLTGIEEKNGSDTGRTWAFTYAGPLPGYTSTSVDHWGFSNGRSGGPHAPLPSMVVDHGTLYPGQSGPPYLTVQGVSREPASYLPQDEPTTIVAGMLRSVRYPTGATVRFEYEPNYYSALSATRLASDRQGKGVRVGREVVDLGDGTLLFNEYDYNYRDHHFLYGSGSYGTLVPYPIYSAERYALPGRSSGVIVAEPSYLYHYDGPSGGDDYFSVSEDGQWAGDPVSTVYYQVVTVARYGGLAGGVEEYGGAPAGTPREMYVFTTPNNVTFSPGATGILGVPGMESTSPCADPLDPQDRWNGMKYSSFAFLQGLLEKKVLLSPTSSGGYAVDRVETTTYPMRSDGVEHATWANDAAYRSPAVLVKSHSGVYGTSSGDPRLRVVVYYRFASFNPVASTKTEVYK